MTVLSDSQAKQVFRDTWSERTVYFPVEDSSHWWVRAQPKGAGHSATCPYLHAPGASKLKTIPDGLWVYVHGDSGYADVFVIEVCRSLQNFNDKRSRYLPTVAGRVLRCSHAWLSETIGQRPRWRVFGTFTSAPSEDIIYPIRIMRCLYALKPDDYTEVRSSLPPEGHEYFIRHASLRSWPNQRFREFLKATKRTGHFYT